MGHPKRKAPKVINKLDVKKVEEEVFGFGVAEENDPLVRKHISALLYCGMGNKSALCVCVRVCLVAATPGRHSVPVITFTKSRETPKTATILDGFTAHV